MSLKQHICSIAEIASGNFICAVLNNRAEQSNIRYSVLGQIVRLLRSFTALSLSPLDISVGAKQYAVITYLFTPNKTFFNTSSEQPQQLSICYDGEVLTVIDSKRYSQEILGKLENFRQSPNSSKLLLLAQNSQTLQNLHLQRQEKENRI